MCKLTVIIPVWNSELYLFEAIESVLNQTFKDFELIALDDGSTDESLVILNEFAQKDSRMQVIACEHQGYSPLLNLGLSMAQGEYIARMDSDDICFPERFEKQVVFLDEHPECVAVGSQALCIDPEGNPIAYAEFPTDHESIDASQIGGKGKIMHPASMIRKDVLINISGYRSEFEPGEDFDLFLRLAETGQLANRAETLLKYRMHTKNVTISKKEKHKFVKNKALEEAYKRRGLIHQNIPIISINESPNNKAEFHFLWMYMALYSGFYDSARKNAWMGFKSTSITKHTLKNLFFGFGGSLTILIKKIYNSPTFTLMRERPIALSLGLVGRIVDYVNAACNHTKSNISKEAYTFALLHSFLQWNNGTIQRVKKGLLKVCIKQKEQNLAVNIRSDSSDIMTFAEVLIAQEYLPVIEFMKQKSDSSIQLIIDAGANIGLSTLFFKSHFPNASVICIEPDIDNISLLNQNINDNEFTNCKVIQGGLWYKDCNLGLSQDFRDGLPWSFRVTEKLDGQIKGIGIKSLLEYCKNQRIGLLKIDIEGSEFDIFRQSKIISSLLSQTDFLVAEIHPEFGNFAEIQSILFENGFFSFKHGHLLISTCKKYH